MRKIIIKTLKEIDRRKNRPTSPLATCVQERLDNSLNYYNVNLLDTCKYVLNRNPIIMMKDFKIILKEEDTDND